MNRIPEIEVEEGLMRETIKVIIGHINTVQRKKGMKIVPEVVLVNGEVERKRVDQVAHQFKTGSVAVVKGKRDPDHLTDITATKTELVQFVQTEVDRDQTQGTEYSQKTGRKGSILKTLLRKEVVINV